MINSSEIKLKGEKTKSLSNTDYSVVDDIQNKSEIIYNNENKKNVKEKCINENRVECYNRVEEKSQYYEYCDENLLKKKNSQSNIKRSDKETIKKKNENKNKIYECNINSKKIKYEKYISENFDINENNKIIKEFIEPNKNSNLDSCNKKPFHNIIDEKSPNFPLTDTDNMNYKNKRNSTYDIQKENKRPQLKEIFQSSDELNEQNILNKNVKEEEEKKNKHKINNDISPCEKIDNFQMYCQNHNMIFFDIDDNKNIKYNNSENIGKNDHNHQMNKVNYNVNKALSSNMNNEVNQFPADNDNSSINISNNVCTVINENKLDLYIPSENNIVSCNKYKSIDNEISFPSIFEENIDEWFRANEIYDWLVHNHCKWLYNVKDNLYFNIRTQEIYIVHNRKFIKFENSLQENSHNGSDEMDSNNFMEKKKQSYANNNFNECFIKSDEYNDSTQFNLHKNIKNINDSNNKNMCDKNYLNNCKKKNMSTSDSLIKIEKNDETIEEFSMVLEDDLVCGTFSKIGENNKIENEDFYITKDILDLNHISECDGLCFFSAIFDGHGGTNCARYLMNHLKTNIIAKFRQSFLVACKKNFKEKTVKLNEQSVEIQALHDSCIKGFYMADKNYIELSKKYNYKDGSTSCVVLIYGPDDDGSLKVVCANCGDSGALICHDKKPIKLSLQHKPDLQEERIRILKCGGIIANINGINRVITKHKNKNNKNKEKTFLALSTSRSFGDLPYKIPRKIVQCKPFVSVYTIDFDLDSYIVLATDGILNVLTDKEIIDIVWKNIHKKPEEAAEEVVNEATKRGSIDDKTCTVIYFYWRKDIFNNSSENKNLDPTTYEDSNTQL